MGLEQLPRLSTQIQAPSINLFPFMNTWLCSAGDKMASIPPEGVSAFQKDKGGESERPGGMPAELVPFYRKNHCSKDKANPQPPQLRFHQQKWVIMQSALAR